MLLLNNKWGSIILLFAYTSLTSLMDCFILRKCGRISCEIKLSISVKYRAGYTSQLIDNQDFS